MGCGLGLGQFTFVGKGIQKMADVFGKLKQFDAYPKTLEDFRVKTYGGAASMFFEYLSITLVTLCC